MAKSSRSLPSRCRPRNPSNCSIFWLGWHRSRWPVCRPQRPPPNRLFRLWCRPVWPKKGSIEAFYSYVPVEFTVARELWVQPARRLLLGALNAQKPAQGVLEVGARQGQLQKPEATILGIPGASVVVVTLDDLKRYQLRVNLPRGLASGPVKGTIHLQLQHLLQGQEHTVERVIQILGVVSDGR
jgi:hypothetical protein